MGIGIKSSIASNKRFWVKIGASYFFELKNLGAKVVYLSYKTFNTFSRNFNYLTKSHVQLTPFFLWGHTDISFLEYWYKFFQGLLFLSRMLPKISHKAKCLSHTVFLCIVFLKYIHIRSIYIWVCIFYIMNFWKFWS